MFACINSLRGLVGLASRYRRLPLMQLGCGLIVLEYLWLKPTCYMELLQLMRALYVCEVAGRSQWNLSLSNRPFVKLVPSACDKSVKN